MHVVWRRKADFEDFIGRVASEKTKVFGGLYVLVAGVESYFELLVRVFLEKIKLTESEKKTYKHRKAVNVLSGKEEEICGKTMQSSPRMINEQDESILHEVRKLRNAMMHDVLYRPDLNSLKQFVRDCFDEELDQAEKRRCSSSDVELERVFCAKVTRAYSEICNRYKQKVDKKIADYLRNETCKKDSSQTAQSS